MDKGHGVSVRSVGPKLLETEPLQIQIIPFLVTNNTSIRSEFLENVQLPEGWRLISGNFPFELGAGKTDVRLVSFVVPITTPAGRYEIIYTVKDQNNIKIRDEDRIEIVILPVARLEIIKRDVPERVIAGKKYHADFLVINRSNVRTLIALDINSSEGYPAVTNIAPHSRFLLAAGTSQKITIAVTTDKAIREKITHHLTVHVKAIDSNKDDVTAAITTLVEVIPRVTGISDRYHRISTWLRIATMSEEGQIATQSEFAGSGYLDEAETLWIDFLFRRPDTTDNGIFGVREEYRLSLRSQRHEIHVGDRSYSLSPLTEQYKYGRGVEGTFNLKNLRLGGYFVDTRVEGGGGSVEEERASFLGYRFGQSLTLDLNYLNKQGTDGDADIVSLEALVRPIASIMLELEHGVGRKRQDGGNVTDDAWRAKLTGDIKKTINYHFEKIYAGSDYPGYYRDLDTTSGTVILPLWKQVRFRTFYAERRNNLKKTPLSSNALKERIYQTGLDYRSLSGTWLSLGYENLRREDILLPADFNVEERAIKMGMGYSFKTLSLFATAWTGQFDNKLTDKINDLERYSIHTNYSPTLRQHYSGYFETGHQSFSNEAPEKTKIAGLNASYNLTHRLFFNINLQKDGLDRETGGNDQWVGSVAYTLPNRHLISLRARQIVFKKSDLKARASVIITYAIPLKIPVGRSRRHGTFRGIIYEAEDPQRRGIPNVVVNVNDAIAVTDKRGEFLFPSLRPGNYFLWLDSGSLGLNRVTTLKTPVEITVVGGREDRIQLGITRSAILKGTATVFQQVDNRNILIDEKGESEKQLVEAERFANLWLELTNGEETVRQATDQNGSFSFAGLRPGKWHLKVYDHNLPSLHYLEQATFELDLKPGSEEDLFIRILPRLRKLQMIETSTISLK